jgi:hypothetical protein
MILFIDENKCILFLEEEGESPDILSMEVFRLRSEVSISINMQSEIEA